MPPSLMTAYKDARVTVRHQAEVEKAVIRSSAVLYDDPAARRRSGSPGSRRRSTRRWRRVTTSCGRSTPSMRQRVQAPPLPATDGPP